MEIIMAIRGCNIKSGFAKNILAAAAVGTAFLSFGGALASVSVEAKPAHSVSAVQAQATGDTTASLNALLAEWSRAEFSPPSKPAQLLVQGRNGYVISGSDYHAMTWLIRSAVADLRQARDSDAANEIAKAQKLLTASRPRAEIQSEPGVVAQIPSTSSVVWAGKHPGGTGSR